MAAWKSLSCCRASRRPGPARGPESGSVAVEPPQIAAQLLQILAQVAQVRRRVANGPSGASVSDALAGDANRVADLDAGHGLFLQVRAAHLRRLAANLVGNALRHNVPGGWVRVETATDGHTAMLRVSNSGPPLPAELVEQLFVPFRRFDADRTGHGLGLSIVAAVVTAHHGRRFARALPDGGLEVAVVLPR